MQAGADSGEKNEPSAALIRQRQERLAALGRSGLGLAGDAPIKPRFLTPRNARNPAASAFALTYRESEPAAIAFEANRLQLDGYGGIDHAWRYGIAAPHTTIGHHAGEKPVKDHAQAVNVGLRRRPRAWRLQKLGHDIHPYRRTRNVGRESKTRQPETCDARLSIIASQNMIRRKMTVNHESAAGVCERLGQGQHKLGRGFGIERLGLSEPFRQGRALRVFAHHGDHRARG